MKNKTLVVTCLGILSLASMSYGAVTINFNAPFAGGLSSNLANTAGVVSNGLTWGLIVDSTNTGFGTSFDALISGSPLLTSSLATGNYFFLGGLTEDSTQSGLIDEIDFAGTGGGNGGIGAMAFDLIGTVTAGDAFRVVWLDGNTGGYLGDGSFVVPADGQIVTLDAPFVGIDPVRSAGNTYAGLAGAPIDETGFTIIPEPSSALLGALGALGLLRRRRN